MSNRFLRRLRVTGYACAVAIGLAACGGGDTRNASRAGTAKTSDQQRVKALAVAMAPSVPAPPTLETMHGVFPPDPAGTENGQAVVLADYVQDRAATIRLGKALFWDMSIGSDGNTACATCHSHAGADNRITNQINPGLNNVDPSIASLFTKPALSASWGPNYTLKLADFPLHVLSDPLDRNSTILSDTNDVIGAQGVFDATFVRPGQSRFDDCILQPDGIFHVGNMDTRRVTGRNSPTVINAAMNVRNFWDGRANNIFNGTTPFGNRDPDAGIWTTSVAGGVASKVRLILADASAASQAVGPPGSDVEMSCGGRSFPNIARRMLDTPMLLRQTIDPSDSVFSTFAGLDKPRYRALIQAAFQPRLWNSAQPVDIGGVPFSQIEANFSLFFGLAIQMYESTLLSDQAPLDAYLQGNTAALGATEIRGMGIFLGKGQCINCHNGPELSAAATALRRQPYERVERMLMGAGPVALYDNGFYNIGVRPTSEDLGVGGVDPWGNPLSFTRQYRKVLQGYSVPDMLNVNPCLFFVKVSLANPCDPLVTPTRDFRDAVDGAFKVPTLRNIALTGPYFHNGSRSTLEQVVEFYNRGGDRRGPDGNDTTGFGINPSNLDPDISPKGMTPAELTDLVAFLRNGLTDPRVAWERAPFDHPSVEIPIGALGDEIRVVGSQSPIAKFARRAKDVTRIVPAVGSGGRSVAVGPLQPFDANLK